MKITISFHSGVKRMFDMEVRTAKQVLRVETETDRAVLQTMVSFGMAQWLSPGHSAEMELRGSVRSGSVLETHVTHSEYELPPLSEPTPTPKEPRRPSFPPGMHRNGDWYPRSIKPEVD